MKTIENMATQLSQEDETNAFGTWTSSIEKNIYLFRCKEGLSLGKNFMRTTTDVESGDGTHEAMNQHGEASRLTYQGLQF